MKISPAGIKLIKSFEGCELCSYPDPGTGGEPWTIGVGHTGSDVKPGMTITQAEADRLLKEDLKRFEDAVNQLVEVPITQGIMDALVSFVFNIGENALAESTLLSLLNQRKYALAGAQLKRWNKANGRELEGLTRRRREEEKLWYSQKFPSEAQ